MPIYEYRCDNGHTFEVMQSMSDDPLTECEVCGAPVQKVLYAPAVHFKGSGFYTTDYGKKKTAGGGSGDSKKDDKGSSSSSSENGSSSSSDSSDKPASKPEPSKSSSSKSSD